MIGLLFFLGCQKEDENSKLQLGQTQYRIGSVGDEQQNDFFDAIPQELITHIDADLHLNYVESGLDNTDAFKAKFNTPEKVKEWEASLNAIKNKCDSPCK